MLFRYKILYEIFNNRISRLPIVYILKRKYFYEHKSHISYPVLIPRSDTEVLVNIASRLMSKIFTPRCLDAGCGSGILSVSLSNINFSRVNAIDLYYSCFKLSKLNVKCVSNIIVFCCNWFYLFFSNIKKFDIIITNPPYISFDEFNLYHSMLILETSTSLFSKKNGLNDLYTSIRLSYDVLSTNGYILLEHGYSQSKNVRGALTYAGFINVCTYNDYNNLNRISYGEK